MRDIYASSLFAEWVLPNMAEHLSTEVTLASFFVSHETGRSRKHGYAEATEYARNVVAAGVDTKARCRDTLEASDRRATVAVVLQVNF
jgi:hypothetical protein